MGKIYRTASTVLAWLGENTTNMKIHTESISLAGAIAFVGRGVPHIRLGTSIYLLSDLKQLEGEVEKNIGGM
jgi:ABC-type cobalamin transport system permease subunit